MQSNWLIKWQHEEEYMKKSHTDRVNREERVDVKREK